MDFSSQLLRGEKVVWSAEIEKRRHDSEVRPAPPVSAEPMMAGEKNKHHRSPRRSNLERDTCADVGHFRLADEQVIRSLRRKWGIG
jgi:hypothetical protein